MKPFDVVVAFLAAAARVGIVQDLHAIANFQRTALADIGAAALQRFVADEIDKTADGAETEADAPIDAAVAVGAYLGAIVDIGGAALGSGRVAGDADIGNQERRGGSEIEAAAVAGVVAAGDRAAVAEEVERGSLAQRENAAVVLCPRLRKAAVKRVAVKIQRGRLIGGNFQASLVVSGRNAYFLQACTLTADTTFTAGRPIVVYDSLVVAPNTTLTLDAGTQLLFHEKAGMVVHGTLIANGTLEAPVILRGDRTDHMFDYLPYDRLPSRWEGLTFTRESHDNQLTYLDLHSGLYGIRCDSTGIDPLKLQLLNARIHNLGGNGLELNHCRAEVANTEISNTLGHCAYVNGGDARFTHCTLAQFYPLSANRGNAIQISNQDSLGYFPLYRADFINCVATGYADDVVMMPSLSREDMPSDMADVPINYQFVHCFLTTVVPEDELYTARFIDCQIDTLEADINREKHFQLFDSHNFLYDFTPVEASAIRGIAASTYTRPYFLPPSQ